MPKHYTSENDECWCEPAQILVPPHGGLVIVHNDVVGYALGLHPLYVDIPSGQWSRWSETKEGPILRGMGRTV